MNDKHINNLDVTIGDFFSAVELDGETCGLKHSKDDPAEGHEAVDYLCQKVGDPKSKTYFYELRIPICQECAEALYDSNWILVYCVNCNKSQWICRRLAKRTYPDGNLIYWLDVCPYCAEVVDKE